MYEPLQLASASGQALPSLVVPPPGPASRGLSARLEAVECPAFDARRKARAVASGEEQGPIVYAAGKGANVWDADGNRYVDFVAGFGALPFGHGDDATARAVTAQMGRLSLALGDVYGSDVKVLLQERLATLLPAPGARVLLGTSGADAVTAALKTAVLATGKAGVLAFEGAYHGLSHGPLAACGLHPSFRAPFAAQLGNHVQFARFPTDDETLAPSLDFVRRLLAAGDVGAILVEPILGRGGCVVPPPGFLPALRTLAQEAGALLVADEIWTGLGRTGALLASRAAGVDADLVCVGKALGGGLPISACIGTADAMEAWGRHGGTVLHTATHFGAPLACAAALAVLDGLATRELPARARTVGARFQAKLRAGLAGTGASVRGEGLMVGVAIEGAPGRALAVSRRLLAAGYLVLTGGTNGNVLTLTPALTIDEPLLDAFVDALAHALRAG